MSEALLGFFVRVLSAEDSKPGGGVSVLTDWVGLDPTSADALYRYIRSSFDDTQRNSAQLIDRLCSRRDQIVNLADFAREVVEMENLHEMQLAANASGIADVLGTEIAQEVIDWVDENIRPTMTLISFDREAQITSGQVDVAAAMASACDRPVGPTIEHGRN